MTIARRTFNRFVALATFGMLGCGSPPQAAPARTGSIRYLALGDSYTIGESVDDSQRWPMQLVARLREEGFDLADPEIIARTGWRTDDLNAAISEADPKGPYSLVSLLIGVNNQYQRRSAESYAPEIAALLDRAVALAGGDASHVLVLSIPDWGTTPFASSSDPASIGRQIDAYNAIKLEACKKAGVRYVDITSISRLAPQQPELVADDGLHPSGKMYAEWVKLALPEARSALGGATTRAVSSLHAPS